MFDKDDDEDDRNDEGGGDSADEGQGQDGAAPGGGAGDSGDSGDGGGPPGGEDASAPDEGDEDEGPRLKKGSRVRWESSGEGEIRELQERGGVEVALVGPSGGWHWDVANFFTTQDTGTPGVPIRLADLQLAEAPKTPEERVERIRAMVRRLHGLARDAALSAESLKTETIGPGAREHLLAYHGGDRGATGDAVRSFRTEVEELGDSAKEAAKAVKAVVEACAFIDESLSVAYQDLLMGTDRQTTIDDVEGGRHKGGGKKKRRKGGAADTLPTEAPASAPPAAQDGPKLIPWGQLRAWGPSGADLIEPPAGPTGKPIEGEALTSFLKGWRAGSDQLGLLVPYDRVGEDGMCEVVIDFERRRIAADKVALVVEQLVKRDGGGTEDVERIVICTPELVDWTGFPGEPEQAAAPGPLTAAQREEALKRGVTPEQIASLEAALRADPEVSQVQLSKITGIERTRLQRIRRAGQEG